MTAMSFVSDRPLPGQVDPAELSAGQLQALRIIRDYRLGRVKGGWRGAGSPKVTLATALVLRVKKLAIERNHHGRQRLEITGTGHNTLAVADQRATRKRA